MMKIWPMVIWVSCAWCRRARPVFNNLALGKKHLPDHLFFSCSHNIMRKCKISSKCQNHLGKNNDLMRNFDIDEAFSQSNENMR